MISIERVGVTLAQREHQTDVRFRGRVQSGRGHPGVRPAFAARRHERREDGGLAESGNRVTW